MAQSIHEYVVSALEPLTFAQIEGLEKESGISKWTIQKIKLRQIENPGVKGIEVLYGILKLRESNKRRRATA